MNLLRRACAEGLGSAALALTVVGSGIMAESMAAGNAAIALLGNTAATVAALYVLISCLGPVSGAHFNPLVSLVLYLQQAADRRTLLAYVPAQTLGAVLGTAMAQLMFARTFPEWSHHVRSGMPVLLGEGLASFGLIAVILVGSRQRQASMAALVAAYIGAGYWCTSSTSFANPAIALARAFTDTFSGIRPIDVPAFVTVELAGGLAALLCCSWLLGGATKDVSGAPSGPTQASSEVRAERPDLAVVQR